MTKVVELPGNSSYIESITKLLITGPPNFCISLLSVKPRRIHPVENKRRPSKRRYNVTSQHAKKPRHPSTTICNKQTFQDFLQSFHLIDSPVGTPLLSTYFARSQCAHLRNRARYDSHLERLTSSSTCRG